MNIGQGVAWPCLYIAPNLGKDPCMAEPKILGVREILSNFRATLATARQTGEPVVIALRRRKPAGVLMGYETWQALQAQLPIQADTSAVQAEFAAERQRNGELAAGLADAQRRVEDMGRDLATARQRVAELEGQLARCQEAGQNGEAWGVESPPEPAARLPETWANWSWGGSVPPEPPAKSGWGQQ
jgi:PHD/YefM family antitoxin component YafN of YafNO toxin-antitoxin module